MIKAFIERPVFTTMVIMVLIVFGIRAYPKLGVDLYPEIDLPLVSVTVTYTGASPEEMETLVIKPIENRVSQVSGIKTMSSTARNGYAQTVIEFPLGTDAMAKASEVREKVASVRGRLPDDIDEPITQRVDLSAQSVVSYTLASKSRSRGEIVRIIENVLKNRLQQVEGVAEVNYYGAQDRELKVYVDGEKLQAYNVPFQTVYNQVNYANANTPAGFVKQNGMQLTVRTLGKFKSVDDMKNVVVSNSNGRVVKLSDVARVEDSWIEDNSFARANNVPGVNVSITKQSGSNSVSVADGVQAAMKEMRETNQLPQDIEVSILKDTSIYIRDNIADVWSSIILGGFLALWITYMFLGNFRATVIGGMAIPSSVIATFVLMKQMHFTLNNMSLLGLSLAVGMLIDDAIVLIENVFRHMEMGKTPKVAALDAAKELSLAILASSLSLIAVFVPIGTMGEVIGQFFAQFGLTVAFAVIFSTFSAYSLTPMLSAHWLVNPKEEAKKPRNKIVQKCLEVFEAQFQAFRKLYSDTIAVAMNHAKLIIVISIVFLGASCAMLPLIGMEFQPTYDSGEFTISAIAPSNVSVQRMAEIMEPVEKIVLQEPGVRLVGMRLGGSRIPPNQSTIDVKLKDVSERTKSMQTIMDELRLNLKDVKNVKLAVMSGQGAGRGDKRPVQIGIMGPDLKALENYANDLAAQIKKIPGATDVDLSSFEAEPEVIVRLDQDKASRMGLTPTSVGTVVQMAFQGKTTTNKFTFTDHDFDIRVELEPDQQRNLEDVRNLLISNTSGNFVRLADIANVTLESGPTKIDRYNRERQVAVYANTVGISAGELTDKIQKELVPAMNLPEGYYTTLIGSSDMMGRSFNEIYKALALAIVVIYMVLAAEFESFSQPLVIMMSLPLALTGAILGLLITGLTINMMSLIGFAMLLGLVTKVAILLIDYTNQARAKGMNIRDSLKESCSLRLRPILMTSVSTMLGIVPIALGLGAGAELRQSMGVVILGGMISSTFLTLIVVPLFYMVFEEWKEKHFTKE